VLKFSDEQYFFGGAAAPLAPPAAPAVFYTGQLTLTSTTGTQHNIDRVTYDGHTIIGLFGFKPSALVS